MGLVGTAKRLHRLLTVGILNEWGSPIGKWLQRRYVTIEEECEMDVEGERGAGERLVDAGVVLRRRL